MARIARVVIPGVPHHVIQRGNRRLRTFFNDQDYEAYTALMARWCAHWGVEIWAYCLMPNHVHLVAVPSSEDGLRKAIGEAHRRYTSRINQREDWRGHLWQGRFSSFPMDESYLFTCIRYIELNPVRAGLVSLPWQHRWSSAPAHVLGKTDPLLAKVSLLESVGDWRTFLTGDVPSEQTETLRRHTRTGRPLGDEGFLARLENLAGRSLRPQKRGPKGPWKKRDGEASAPGPAPTPPPVRMVRPPRGGEADNA